VCLYRGRELCKKPYPARWYLSLLSIATRTNNSSLFHMSSLSCQVTSRYTAARSICTVTNQTQTSSTLQRLHLLPILGCIYVCVYICMYVCMHIESARSHCGHPDFLIKPCYRFYKADQWEKSGLGLTLPAHFWLQPNIQDPTVATCLANETVPWISRTLRTR
jgi:hypothetical protein